MKQCSKCQEFKNFSEFSKDKHAKDGLSFKCKECAKIAWRDFKNNGYTEYRKTSKNHLNEIAKIYQKSRRIEDENFRILGNLRNRIYKAFKGLGKNKNIQSLLGCDLDVVRDYIESLFQSGMSWENYGEWHIDHKIPLASANNKEELEKLCHYTNLQPLWATDNLKKSNKLVMI